MASDAAGSDAERRAYHSPVRQQRVAETRDRIVAAGAELAHSLPVWDWSQLTLRLTADRAGVGLRTIYRYFPTEQQLHDAVMRRLEEQAGVTYEGIVLDDVPAVASKMFASLPTFSLSDPRLQHEDSMGRAADERRRRAVLKAVGEAAPRWDEASKEAAAAAIDVLWGFEAYSRLVRHWSMDDQRAAEVVSWVIGLVTAAINADQHPRHPS
jgi:AcrR family transcriptional regulator